MNCSPELLVEAAKCFRCIPQGQQGAIQTYLLCQWANNLTVEQFAWTPAAFLINDWTDGAGFHFAADLPTFLATADLSTVTIINAGATGIDSFTNLDLLPSLTTLTADNNPGLLTLDCSNCFNLQSLQCSTTGLTSIDVTNCTSLITLTCNSNGALISIVGLPTCTALITIDFSLCSINGTLDFSGLAMLTLVTCNNNANLAGLNFTNCISLTFLNCNTCASLTTLTLTGCVAITTLIANTCDITGLFTVSNSPLLVLCDLNANPNMTSLVCTNNAVDNLGANNCTSLTTIDLTGSNNIGDLEFSNSPVSNITLPVSFSAGIDRMFGDGAALPQISVDGILALLVATGAAGGTCDLSGGTNAQPSNCIDVNTLRGPFFWIVNVNGPC